MAVLLAAVVDGLGLFATTIWRLQRRRLSSTFDAASAAASSLAAALLLGIVSFQWRRPGDLGIPFI